MPHVEAEVSKHSLCIRCTYLGTLLLDYSRDKQLEVGSQTLHSGSLILTMHGYYADREFECDYGFVGENGVCVPFKPAPNEEGCGAEGKPVCTDLSGTRSPSRNVTFALWPSYQDAALFSCLHPTGFN